jgi:hypothetical protein
MLHHTIIPWPPERHEAWDEFTGVAKIAKPTGSKLVKGAAESGDLFGGSRRKIAKKIADHRPS